MSLFRLRRAGPSPAEAVAERVSPSVDTQCAAIRCVAVLYAAQVNVVFSVVLVCVILFCLML